MIDGNRLKFGYGDICVGANELTCSMHFQQFKPPAKCGDRVSEDVEFIGEEIVFHFSYDDYCEFSKNLDQIFAKKITEFTFKGYVFDFSNYKEESVNVCREKLNNAMRQYFLCLAA